MHLEFANMYSLYIRTNGDVVGKEEINTALMRFVS